MSVSTYTAQFNPLWTATCSCLTKTMKKGKGGRKGGWRVGDCEGEGCRRDCRKTNLMMGISVPAVRRTIQRTATQQQQNQSLVENEITESVLILVALPVKQSNPLSIVSSVQVSIYSFRKKRKKKKSTVFRPISQQFPPMFPMKTVPTVVFFRPCKENGKALPFFLHLCPLRR